MNLLFFGDLVGAPATAFVVEHLPHWRREHRADLVVANAENCAPSGLGMAAEQVTMLLDAGVDVITGGNHSWDSEESVALLDLPQVLRPYNIAPGERGQGSIRLDVDGEQVTVVNLADRCALHSYEARGGTVRPAYAAFSELDRDGTVIVDYHGDHVLEKQVFAHAVAGEATAVMGTHTHEATIPLHLLPGGTAFVTEVGMTGPAGGVQGFHPGNLATGLRTAGDPFALPIPPLVEGPIVLGAVLIEIHGHRAVDVRRIC